MLKLLIKTLGFTFYKQHVGLFAVFFYLLFGMIKGYDLINFHIALLISICTSPINLLLLFLFWLLYILKCIHFVSHKLKQEGYQFAKLLTTMPKMKQFKIWLKLYAFLLLPILLYAVLIMFISLKNQYYFSFFTVLIGLGLIFCLIVNYTFRSTNFTFYPSKNLIDLPILKFHKPFWAWPLFYLLNEQRIVFLVCKVVSIVFFKAILLVFADVGIDVRVYLTAILAVILSHAILILNLIRFDAFYMSFAKNLSISALRRFSNWLSIFTILLLPEFILLVVITQINGLGLLYCVLFAVGGMLVFQMLIYGLKADTDRYMRYLLFFFFIAMFSILAKFYLLFSALMLISSAITYLWNYNKLDLKELTG